MNDTLEGDHDRISFCFQALFMSEFGPAQGDDVQLVDIEEEIKQSYLEYAMSVIVGRALPDARDGLKPVHKRVLLR